MTRASVYCGEPAGALGEMEAGESHGLALPSLDDGYCIQARDTLTDCRRAATIEGNRSEGPGVTYSGTAFPKRAIARLHELRD